MGEIVCRFRRRQSGRWLTAAVGAVLLWNVSAGARHFFLESSSHDLIVHFSAVPEPATAVLLGVLVVSRLRRQRREEVA